MIASGNCRKIFIILGINKGMCRQKKSCVEVLSVKIVGNNIYQYQSVFCEQLSWCKIENFASY